MTRILLLALTSLALAACSSTGSLQTSARATAPVFDGDTDTPDRCGARARGYLIGQRSSEVDLSSLGEGVRVIHPGSAVTEDYRPSRLNLDVSAEDVILRAWCG
jgi:hypothetical protein